MISSSARYSEWQHRSPPCMARDRRGFVLILVLVVIMMLSFAAYSFSHRMLTEYTAGKFSIQQVQRRLLAESALELATVRAHRDQLQRPARLTLSDGLQGQFEVVPGINSRTGAMTHGVINESSRLNLNTLKVDSAHREETRTRLLQLPGMTPTLADSLLGWLANSPGSDRSSDSFLGAKEDAPRRIVEQLSDLLEVRGMSRELLWGEDQNQNTILDAEEDDGAARWPTDNRDGQLDLGLSQYLTVHSAESPLDSLGRPRIVLNQTNIASLFDDVQQEFGTNAALFIVACRMNGATYSDALRPDEGDNLEKRKLERFETARQRMRAQLGLADEGNSAAATGAGQVRAGMTLTQPAVTFRSLVDLFGGHVRILINGRDTVINSPWPADPATLTRELPRLQERFALEDKPAMGRININEADEAVLRAIPGVSESQARSIFHKQPKAEDRRPEYRSIAWLLTQGLLTPGEFREFAPWITTGGDVFSGLAVGRIAGQGSASVIQFRVDCTSATPALLFRRELPTLDLE